MVAFARLIMLASAVAAATTQLLPRDFITVTNDLAQQIGPQLTTLNNAIIRFPASGAEGAEKISRDAIALVQILKTATGHVKEAEIFGLGYGTTVLAQLQLHVPAIIAPLRNIRERASSWKVIEGPKLGLEDLKAGKEAWSNYLDAIAVAEPSVLKPAAIAIKMQIMSAFDATIAVFSKS
ncbi:hypothetical protein ACQKWADRAFT_22991 [Trichoderma austrokoningii]